ncbi:hypothetical protein V5O48_015011 [Marasmius crinis-equi]|uniref:Amine oxidase n=1 Tax=Marasmius crinis-equi TaxID=585013 RepID=A0ABR3EVR0_9AGAR
MLSNFQGGYAIVNKQAQTAWGYPRGYALQPGPNPIQTTVVGSKRALENVNWGRYNLAVSKRKESEPASSSMWDQNLTGDPPVNFHNFFDGESLDQEDLIMWVNVGMHHIPSAEDVPNTKTNIATSSFMLFPVNYFDYDVSINSRNAIVLFAPTETPEITSEVYGFEDYGVKQEFACIPDASPPPFRYDSSWQRP